MKPIRLPVLLLAALLARGAAAQEPVTPDAHLGRPLGQDFQLADWKEVSGYFRHLAATSPHVLLDTVGTTTEGRDFLLATISSPANLARLGAIRAAARRIADPRGLSAEEREALLQEAKPILFISCAMHSTETAAPQMGMELAYRLATSEDEPYASARERLVVLLAPTLNPDGLDEVVSWYRRTVGTPHEGSGLTRLYQLYAGHDNNRDWFSLTQAETRIVTRLLYGEWFPTVYWDVHQQGRGRERFFLPPYRDPLNPNLDPAIIAGIDALGSRALLDLTRAGFQGVSTGVTYDMWWNGGNRNVPVRHNIIGILTEAASVNLASPVFLPRDELKPPRGLGGYAPSNRFPDPWPGGWWRLRDIIDYELAFGRSLLGSLCREPQTWLRNALEAAERAVARGEEGAPRAWLVPSDNRERGAARRLIEGLLLGGVEVHVAEEAFVADGREWPAGSVVIQRAQPYGAHVKDLFEVQRYPEGEPPYDVAGWTLPLLFGVRRVEVVRPFEAKLRRVADAEEAVAAFPAPAETRWDLRDSDTWRRVFAELREGRALELREEEPGTAVCGPASAEAAPPEAEEGAPASRRLAAMPRLGVYAPWWGVKNEGWLRWVLDDHGVPYRTVRNEMLRAGELGSFLDVLVLPGMRGDYLDEGRTPGTAPPEFTGGLDPEGAVAVEEFVRGGGTLIALGSSGAWVRELLQLPLVDVTDEGGAEEPGFSCPGSVLRAVPEPGPFTVGLPASLAVFFSRSAAWRLDVPEGAEPPEGLEVLLRYAPTRVLLSGWIQAPEVIAGRAAWVRATHGAGRVHLFGFRPQYRGWSQGTFQLLFRAILFEAEDRE